MKTAYMVTCCELHGIRPEFPLYVRIFADKDAAETHAAMLRTMPDCAGLEVYVNPTYYVD